MEINSVLFCFSTFLFLQQVSTASAFFPSYSYFIDCGSNQITHIGTRTFMGDSPSQNHGATSSNSSFLIRNLNSSIALEDPDPSTTSSVLYHTARIFTSPTSFEFNLNSSSTHVLRLHFFPFSSQGRCLSSAMFDVSVSMQTELSEHAGRQLLEDFSVQSQGSAPVIKEFFLRSQTYKLVLLFSSFTSFAFVNAIEVFPVPENLIPADTVHFISSMGIMYYNGLSRQVLKTVHRINVGGPEITSFNDTLWRTWIPDEEFLKLRSNAKQAILHGELNYQNGVSYDIAPMAVYATAQEMNHGRSATLHNFNLTWVFPVHPRFKYLVRMHFCDIVSLILDDLYFNVYFNDYISWEDLNLSSLTKGGLATPYYADFIVDPDNSGLIRVSVGPSEKGNPSKRNAILNGVEIMQMCGLLDDGIDTSEGIEWYDTHPKRTTKGVVPVTAIEKVNGVRKNTSLLVASALGGICFISVVLIAAFGLVVKLKKRSEDKEATPSPHTSTRQRISLADIKLATNDFDENFLIGHGGFGNVYKGVLKNRREVAVKRSTPGSRQGLPEFLAEIEIFSKIRHCHLVSLIGYCEEESELILVYEFMENGTLKDHLYGPKGLPCLSWRQRLQICIGSARGLHYLHTGPAQEIIHRDVKSANILLDKNYLAKVTDFGISKLIPVLGQSHVTTNVKGNFGYFDPEYFRLCKLTKKSDVYSFGVVLIEILCARPAVDHSLQSEPVNLADWAMQWQERGLLDQIVDPRIMNEINADSLTRFGDIAEKCLAECGADRPTMGEVLWNLEYALRLQETAMHATPPEDCIPSASESPLTMIPTMQGELNKGIPHSTSTLQIQMKRAVALHPSIAAPTFPHTW